MKLWKIRSKNSKPGMVSRLTELSVDFGLVFAEGHEAGLLAGHSFHEKVPDPHEQGDGEEPGEKIAQEGGLDFSLEHHVILCQEFRELRVHPDGLKGFRLLGPLAHSSHLALDLILRDRNLRDLVVFQQGEEFAVGNGWDGKCGDHVVLDEQHDPYA